MSWTNAFSTVASLAMATVLGTTGAQANNIIVNGDFEISNGAGWTINANNTAIQPSGYEGELPQSGVYFMALGDISTSYPYGTISQTVSDTAGQHYLLRYYLMSGGSRPNYFDAAWNGATLAGSVLQNVPDQRPNGYVSYSFDLVGTGSDTLIFHEQNIPAYWALDNVSLTPAVPEPAAWAMMLLGLGAIGSAMRRRREQTALAAC